MRPRIETRMRNSCCFVLSFRVLREKFEVLKKGSGERLGFDCVCDFGS